ncbi:MAG: RluA family pseudouridine synthase [Chlamydiales bacterium]
MKILCEEEVPLLDLLKKWFPESSNNTLRSWLEKERVFVQGKVVRLANQLVKKGERVEVGPKVQFLRGDIRLLYEDAHIAVVVKPEGLLSVATDFDNQCAHAILKRHANGMVYPVQRLDRDTSGVMVFTYTQSARKGLQAQFKEHTVERAYMAIVEGVLSEKKGAWKSYLVEDADYFMHSGASPEQGKFSVTHYEVISERRSHSLVRFRLETGRKNQIRVHSSEAGHPIAGDEKYGAKTNPAKRLCLHAYQLGFIHPENNKKMQFNIPLPDSFTSHFPHVQIKK